MNNSVGLKWYDLGLELFDVYDAEKLNTIEAENKSDLYKCCTKMFNLWLQNQSTASWNQLIEALKYPNIGLCALAMKIERMLLQPNPKG